jgi:ferredoxin
MLVINPDECIDCGLCEPECPANAIFDEVDLPADQIEFIEINAIYSEKWPVIVEMIDAHPDADANNGTPNKRPLLEE